MDSYVSVPRDLSRVKTKVIFNLTKRQLLCFGGAVLVGLPSYFGTRNVVGTSAATMLMIFVMLPMFLLALYEKDGQPLEVHAQHFIQAKFIRPRVRLYQTDNIYAALQRQYQVNKEVNAIVQAKEGGRAKALCKPVIQAAATASCHCGKESP